MDITSCKNKNNNCVWFLYILNCDGKRFYTGITNDVQRRYNDHLRGNFRGAKFTRGAYCIELVYTAAIGNKSMAAKIEYRVKRLTRERKACIVEQQLDKGQLMEFLNLSAVADNFDASVNTDQKQKI